MFKCNNINHLQSSTVTMSLTEVQQSQESQLPKSTKNRFGCLIKVVIIKKVFSEVKCSIRIMVKKKKKFRFKENSLTFWEIRFLALRSVR